MSHFVPGKMQESLPLRVRLRFRTHDPRVRYYTCFAGEKTEDQPTAVRYLRFPDADAQRVTVWGTFVRLDVTRCDSLEHLRDVLLGCVFLISFFRLLSAVPQMDLTVVLLPADPCPCITGLYFLSASKS